MNSNEVTETKDSLDILIEKYPIVFANMNPNTESSIPPGWFNHIDKLCADLHEMLATELMENPDTKEEPLFIIEQIKEKYGGLRFYFFCNTKNMPFFKKLQQLIDKAEDESYSICEVTGKLGTLCKSGWHFKTLSEECRESMGYKMVGIERSNPVT